MFLDVHDFFDCVLDVKFLGVLAEFASSYLTHAEDVFNVEQKEIAAGRLDRVAALKVSDDSCLLHDLSLVQSVFDLALEGC